MEVFLCMSEIIETPVSKSFVLWMMNEHQLAPSVGSSFGILRVLISDNGKQFDCKIFKEFTRNMNIWHKFLSVAHPQTNGQTEVTNQAILQGLKKRLDKAKKNWADELNSILWAFWTTPRTPTKETPFALAFGSGAVVPIELQVPTHRVQFNNEDTNSDKLRSNLDALKEIRESSNVIPIIMRLSSLRKRKNRC
ncbi:uncharacterized protein K02A2.6-like [Manihot esculenta]|uniref:uncharacterized protein K02A2.6-like n=1 Tax=Manihot esculenta TaxID=3983 RepID=UPI001CC71628|nr:uncharacterized protein K02A2.6-like [Manihot esculenta]